MFPRTAAMVVALAAVIGAGAMVVPTVHGQDTAGQASVDAVTDDARTVSAEDPDAYREVQAALRAERRERAERRAARAAARAASDLTGVQTSAYRGRYYDPVYESVRRCIVERESDGQYEVVSSNGAWHGAYQFALGTSDVAARRMGRTDLVGTPASSWDRAEQDEAFWTMWDRGRGAGHWAGGRWEC